MSAWDILTGNSTAPANSDAWTHLNNQAGGAGNVYLMGDAEVRFTLNEYAAAFINESYSAVFKLQTQAIEFTPASFDVGFTLDTYNVRFELG